MRLKLLGLVLALSLPAAGFAADLGNEGANGGDEVALEFRLAFVSGLTRIQQKLPLLYAKIKDAKLEEVLERAEILVSDQSLLVKRDGIYQDSIAINKAEPPQILIHRRRWNEILRIEIKEALALHEVASLVGLESTGKYPLSGEYLKLFSLGADPEFDFTPTCGRLESMLYRRELGRFDVGETTRVEVLTASVELQRMLQACGILPKKEFCEVVVPALEVILQGTKEYFDEGWKSKQDLERAEYELKHTKEYCDSEYP